MEHEKEFLTQEKFDELSTELKQLTTVRRKEIAESLEYAKSLGDLSENAEYHEAREQQASIEERIAQLEHVLKNAEIVKRHHSDVVEVGSTVTVEKEGGDKKTFDVVSPEEADVAGGRISYRSPLGEAMLRKKKGDVFVVETPRGSVEYKVVKID